MPDIDPKKMHEETIEYYRLTLAAHKRDKYAVETVKADEAILDMVKKTPDALEMGRQFNEGGLSFNLGRAIAVDGANQQADIYDKLNEEPLAECYRKRAAALAASEDMDELYAISDKMDKEDEPIKQSEARLKSLLDTIIEKLMLADAAPPGTGYDDSELTMLKASFEELNERYPGLRFPDILIIPRLRKRLFYSDKQLKDLSALFDKVNSERLGGKY
ncbi:MAG: hypothetical protein GY771_00210 [bacterium]|nr:hypothetical protein [bacterium]